MRLAENVVYLSREEWGADPDYPRLGYLVPRGRRTHVIQHHTVGQDDDDTPALWETEHEVKREMRRLQFIRPDLGNDVPYSFVFFQMKSGDLYVCEGRGADRTGAHTRGHNTKGIGCAWHANFQRYPFGRRYIAPASWFFDWLKYERGLVNLGTVKPPNRDTFGHRDFAQTACPGQNLYNEIGDFTFYKEDDMRATARIVGEQGAVGYFEWLTGATRHYIPTAAAVQTLIDGGVVPSEKEIVRTPEERLALHKIPVGDPVAP